MTGTILLIDVMAEAFRAFHALPKTITTSDGQIINALLGFHFSLKELFKRFAPSHCAAAWSSGTSFRKSILPDYKAHRNTPELLQIQKPLIEAYLCAVGIPQFSVMGYEADDVLASLVTVLRRHTGHIIVDTIDKDLLPLCSEGVKIWNFRTKSLWDEVSVKNRFGVPPRMLTDLLIVTGDKTDAIRGIKGLGSARAADLLNRFGGLDELRARQDELDEPTRQKFQDGVAVVRINLQVIPLVRSVPLDIALDSLAVNDEVRNGLDDASAALRLKDLGFLYSE